MTHLGPHSRPGKLAIIDGRSAEARRMKAIRQELVAHLGNSASTTQRMMIDRIAMLTLRVELMDRKALKLGGQTDHDSRQYLAWANSISKMLRHLGLAGQPAKQKSLADHLAERAH
jgi:hypothetical protein